MYKIVLALILSGCATGTIADPEPPTPPIQPQRPAPIEDAGNEDSAVTCEIVKSVWGGNCVVNVIECSDGTKKLDSKCYPPDWIPPWKNLPDPPY